jgi:hypothetical protein
LNAYERFDLTCTAVDQAKALHDLLVRLGDDVADWDAELVSAVSDVRASASVAWSEAVRLMTAVSRDLA